MQLSLTITCARNNRVVHQAQYNIGQRRVLKIGRSKAMDVVLHGKQVARVHAVLMAQNGEVWVRDLGTLQGIQKNGIPVGAGGARLEPNDALQIGDTTLWASVGATAAVDVEPPVFGGSPAMAQAGANNPQLGVNALEAAQQSSSHAVAVPVGSEPARRHLSPRTALLERLANMSDATRVEVHRFIERLAEASYTPAAVTSGGAASDRYPVVRQEEYYDTRRIVTRMRREERHGRFRLVLFVTGFLTLMGLLFHHSGRSWRPEAMLQKSAAKVKDP